MTETLKEFAATIRLVQSAALGTAVLISVGFGAIDRRRWSHGARS